MDYYLQLLMLMLGTIGVIHTFYRLRKEIFVSKYKQKQNASQKQPDTPAPTQSGKHA
ncbi:MAG TPA: hypothetical protein VF939_06510 [Puia sp.]